MIKIKNILIILFFFCLFFNNLKFINSFCNEGQIDINSANASELDRIITIGEVLAQRIIDSRPFYSLDDLIKVKGIGNITLSKIKSQGLACVNEQSNSINNSKEIKNEETNNFNETKEELNLNKNLSEEFSFSEESIEKDNHLINSNKELINNSNEEEQIFFAEKIILNSKDIKTEKSKISLEEISLIGILLLGFILILLILKKRKQLKNGLQ
jgi:hypothetical protein